ncbi:hypothetical protein CDAR_454331 [Caerostris darwini]|uniref:Uncharacterized protein n=1 Tax=Caerostris darwini TaxID=1538125 RepID=A0AAV4V7M8_9ARAC|nr:hypothetical protein CDAR_454331 [Caerostris darwini]
MKPIAIHNGVLFYGKRNPSNRVDDQGDKEKRNCFDSWEESIRAPRIHNETSTNRKTTPLRNPIRQCPSPQKYSAQYLFLARLVYIKEVMKDLECRDSFKTSTATAWKKIVEILNQST